MIPALRCEASCPTERLPVTRNSRRSCDERRRQLRRRGTCSSVHASRHQLARGDDLRALQRLDQWIEGRPQILIHDGHVFGDVLRDQKVSMGELQSALRQHGCETLEEVHCAILGPNGAISVISTKASDKPDSNPPPR